jgi:AcrR family transcriptional regulator
MKYPDTKKVILEKSLDFFSTHGYAGTSIRQIAKAVGIRESAIYNHFKSKEEIFLAIISDYKSKDPVKDILTDELLDDLSDPQKFLFNFSKRIVEKWNEPEERKFIRLVLLEQFIKVGSVELSISKNLFGFRSMCKIIFSEMIKAGAIKNISPEVLAEEFLTPLLSFRIEFLSDDTTDYLEKAYDAAAKHVNFFWSGINLLQ